MNTRIRELRKKAGVTQQALADYLQMSCQGYAQYEKETREAGYAALSKLADYYNCTVDYLLGRTEKAPAETRSAIVEKYGAFQDDPTFLSYCDMYVQMSESQRIFCVGMIYGYLREQGVRVHV